MMYWLPDVMREKETKGFSFILFYFCLYKGKFVFFSFLVWGWGMNSCKNQMGFYQYYMSLKRKKKTNYFPFLRKTVNKEYIKTISLCDIILLTLHWQSVLHTFQTLTYSVTSKMGYAIGHRTLRMTLTGSGYKDQPLQLIQDH